MRTKIFVFLTGLFFVCLGTLALQAQDIQTRGSIKGTITDPGGSVVSGATVKITGSTGERTIVTGSDGTYEVTNLTPGLYNVRIEQSGFKSIVASNQTVYVGRATVVDGKLEIGEATAVVEVTAGNDIDQAVTAVGTNLNDQLFANVPIARGVSGLFYLAPGTTDGLGGGTDNPSISGGSALDNLYIADGVNITNSAFGGIGTFSRSYGALGTGINTSFVKEVQVKTGGFEPQYGQSTGGIVNIITQSGSNKFHGAVYGFMRPDSFEGEYKQRDDFSFNKVGKLLARENYDVGVDIGGPIVKDKLFFFGSFNPSVRRDIVEGAEIPAATALPRHHQRYRTFNYAGKIDWNVVQNHSVTFSIFGDPTKTNRSSFSTLNTPSSDSFSVLDYGSHNLSLRYNGALSSSWTLSASYGRNGNKFDETDFDDTVHQIFDRTGVGVSTGALRGQFFPVGRGFYEPTNGATHNFSIDTNKTVPFLGQHSIGIGFQYQKAFYSGLRARSGPRFAIPATNADGSATMEDLTGFSDLPGEMVDAAFSLRVASNSDPSVCTLCPVFFVPGATNIGLGPGMRRVYLRQDRGEYGPPNFDTFAGYHAAYAQDTWRFNRFVTALVGIRWEQERVTGSEVAGDRFSYSFTGQWSPRLGVTVDPLGTGKMKAYYNFGRFHEYMPLDVAERSLSLEQDFIAARFAPQFATCVTPFSATDRCATINSFGTVTPALDAAHLLNAAAGGTGGGIAVFSQGGTPIVPGTKLGYLEEHVVGFETQLPKNFVLSVRYIDRDMKRIIEDAAVASPEASINGMPFFAYFIGNVSATLDAAINPIAHTFTPGGAIPAACDPDLVIDPVEDPRTGAVLGAICYEGGANVGGIGSDGIPDGFVDPVRRYRAVEIEVNKRFSDNWQLLGNWRIASLKGNFEGHLRNDNGQTDPGISSLFDFTEGEFNLLGDQFATGPLNSDRRHVINIFGSYAFTKAGFGGQLQGLNLGFNFHSESGLPISEFLAHPAYLNAGEIPVGGRGKLGRTAWNSRLDLHADYPWNITESMRLKFIADFFNVTNTRKIRQPQEFAETTVGVTNVDFLQPRSFYAPFNMRLGLRFEF